MRARLAGLAAGTLMGLTAATQSFAWTYSWSPLLGPAWRAGPDLALYAPWSIIAWRKAFGDEARTALDRSGLLVLLGAMGGLGFGVFCS